MHFSVRILYNFKLNLSYTTPWGQCVCPDPSKGIWKMKNIHLTNFFLSLRKKKGQSQQMSLFFFLVIESSVITYTNTYRYVKKLPPKKKRLHLINGSHLCDVTFHQHFHLSLWPLCPGQTTICYVLGFCVHLCRVFPRAQG